MKIDYTLWPNAEGNLGEIKVAIPDGVTEKWPTGDALVGNFVYDDGLISGFVDTKALIANESKTSTFPYDYVNITVDKSLEGVMTFNPGERTKYFTVNYVFNGGNTNETVVLGTKYINCVSYDDLITIDADYSTVDIIDGVWKESLSNLTDSSMGGGWIPTGCFWDCDNLYYFISDLHSLENGGGMFRNCDYLVSFEADLSNLTNGFTMFSDCVSLISLSIPNLNSLTNGQAMFKSCSSLTSFDIDLPNLTNGSNMFYECENLLQFKSNLASLENGTGMFEGCKLDTQSIKNIAETIKSFGGIITARIDIGIKNSSPSSEEDGYFNQIYRKGWSVYVNGTNIDGESESNEPMPKLINDLEEQPISINPYYAKPVPATEETADYVDENNNYFNILGGQFIYVSDPETYGMFTSLEDAAANMRLTKIEKSL